MLEQFKNHADFLVGDSFAGVLDFDAHGMAVFAQPRPHRHAPFRRKLRGVIDEIVQNLLQLGVIALHERHVVGNLLAQFDRFFADQRLRRDHDILNRVAQFDVFNLKLHLARLNFRKIENVVDQLQQGAGGAFRLAQIFKMLRRDAGLQRADGQRRVANHGVERRSQFMAHAQQKFILILPRFA